MWIRTYQLLHQVFFGVFKTSQAPSANRDVPWQLAQQKCFYINNSWPPLGLQLATT